jgi:hypothetical protein
MFRKLAAGLVAAQLCTLGCARSKTDESITPIPEPLRSVAPWPPLAPDAGVDWVLVRDEDGLFEVSMPSGFSMKRAPMGQVTVATTDEANGSFALSVADMPPDKSLAGDVERILDAVQKGITMNVGRADIPAAQRLKISGYPARELLYPVPMGAPIAESWLLCFAKQRYVFRLHHSGPRAARDRFFGSLKVDGVPRSPPGGTVVRLK